MLIPDNHGREVDASTLYKEFQIIAEKEKLKRSVLILWVSGEEIGLYGSKYYVENPLIPLDQTIANLNLDMVGTVRTESDRGMIHGEVVSVMGMDTISLIGGHQSTETRLRPGAADGNAARFSRCQLRPRQGRRHQ